jgi:predicted outer membrane repeat protein
VRLDIDTGNDEILLERLTFVDNNGAVAGAGLEMVSDCDYWNSVEAIELEFDGNVAADRGGAIHVDEVKDFTCTTCDFGLNTPEDLWWDYLCRKNSGGATLSGTTDVGCSVLSGC